MYPLFLLKPVFRQNGYTIHPILSFWALNQFSGFLIEQRRRKGEYSIAGGLYTGTEDSPIFVRAISHETTQNIPGISDEPPKYESLTLDVQLPTYTDLSV